MRDLLLSRLKLHQDCAARKEPSSEEPEYHARMAQSVAAEIEKLTEANGGWKLEVLESSERLKQAIADWTTKGHEEELAVAQLDIDERLLTALDTRGVIWLRELLEWTEPMILALPMVAESLLQDLKYRLAERGLKLRESAPGEEPEIPAVKYRLGRTNGEKGKGGRKPESATKVRHRGILRGLSDGAQPENLARQFSTTRRTVENFRQRLRERVMAGEKPFDIAKGLGFIHGEARSRAIVYLRSLAT